jgi:thioesterase domain-containing protein
MKPKEVTKKNGRRVWARRLLPASGRVEVFQVPGNHYTVVREPHVRALAQNLNACL